MNIIINKNMINKILLIFIVFIILKEPFSY